MYCSKCGKEIPDSSTFCLHCGNQIHQPIATVTTPPASGIAITSSTARRGKSSFAVWLLVIVAGGLLFTLILVAVNNEKREREQTSLNSQNTNVNANLSYSSTSNTRQAVPASTRLASAAFTVAPSQYLYWKFTVPDNTSSNAGVSGNFRAAGGSGNDVEVFILDEDGFENFKNGHAARTYYNSGKVTVGTVNARLSPGVYYIVFSNTFSAFSNKAITSDIHLDY
jgi:hypothetical protein